MRGALLVCGTASDVGKSVVVAGLCRWLARQGVRVAPFKAQNLALNSAVTADGHEIGRAQYAQALAAGVEPEVAMNPVLVKPTDDRRSQVVVRGRPAFDAGGGERDRHAELLPIVLDSLADLRRRFDVVVCEGAGSAAEINLRRRDLANLGLARAADLPVVVVGDIDRGGVFAAMYGTLALLEPEDQAHVAGFVVNRFRGDPAMLADGLAQFEERAGRPILGVLPHVDGLGLDAEDALALGNVRPPRPDAGTDHLRVAVVRLPRISNFTDLDALACEPGVHVTFTTSAEEVAAADLAVLPGSKNTVADLHWLRREGLAAAVEQRVREGAPVLGICGGYQMLGSTIEDDVESRAGHVDGLGLLPVATRFAPEKLVRRRQGHSPLLDAPAGGYEIRHGHVDRHGGSAWLVASSGEEEGCAVDATWGTSWHGILEHDELRWALLAAVATRRGRTWRPGVTSFHDLRQQRYDRIADLVDEHLDTAALRRLIEQGTPAGLPLVGTGSGHP